MNFIVHPPRAWIPPDMLKLLGEIDGELAASAPNMELTRSVSRA